MARIVKNGVTYSQDATSLATALTEGSTTVSQTSGKLETKAGYVRGDTSTGSLVEGLFKIYSGTADPDASLGQNGDIYLKRVS